MKIERGRAPTQRATGIGDLVTLFPTHFTAGQQYFGDTSINVKTPCGKSYKGFLVERKRIASIESFNLSLLLFQDRLVFDR